AALGHVFLEHYYAAVWHGEPGLAPQESHGLDPVRHLERCRALAAEHYRPVALSVAWMGPGQPLATVSAWQRPRPPTLDREDLALRQTELAVLLLHLGQAESVWPLLRHAPDPRLRSELIDRLSQVGLDPDLFVRRLEVEADVSARRALVLTLGGSID